MIDTRYYQAGAWLWIATGVTHDALDLVSRVSPTASDKTLDEAMRNMPFDYFGLARTYYEVSMGISLGMGLAMVFAGVLLLFIRHVAVDVRHMRQAAVIGLVGSLTLLAISVAFEPPPPIVTFALASLSFAAALSRTQERGVVRPAGQIPSRNE